MAEATRLMIDACGGFVADFPSDRDFANPEVGDLLKKYLKAVDSVPVENRIRMYRLQKNWPWKAPIQFPISMAGGSPEAHRVTIFRETNVENKKKAARRLAGIEK